MKNNRLTIGIISHLVRDYNLGCAALAISNIALMDSVFKENNVDVRYVVILPEPKEKMNLSAFTSLDGLTVNPYTYATYPRLKRILLSPWLISKSKAVDECDYIIDLCGGDGYTDNYGLIRLMAESVPVYLSKAKNIPICFAPQTIGPFNTRIGQIIAKHTLNKLVRVFVRDFSSFECCKQQLNLSAVVSQVIDVAFALPYKKRYKTNNKIAIGINVSGLLYNGGYNHHNYFSLSFSYKEFIDKLIKILTTDTRYEVHLIAHVISDTVDIDDDYRVCEKLANENAGIILAPKFISPIEAKNYISGMDIFSGARMHSTIGAISSGVPVIPIAYSRKFNGLYHTLEYPYLIDAKAKISCEDAIEMFMNYLEHREELVASISKAQEIYTAGLRKYKEDLKDLFHLKKSGTEN